MGRVPDLRADTQDDVEVSLPVRPAIVHDSMRREPQSLPGLETEAKEGLTWEDLEVAVHKAVGTKGPCPRLSCGHEPSGECGRREIKQDDEAGFVTKIHEAKDLSGSPLPDRRTIATSQSLSRSA